MATSNLQTQSLGDILVESGVGTPDHVSPKGSYYTNISTGSIFINTTSTSTGWEMLNKVAWGEMYIQSNTQNIGSGSIAWASFTGLTNWSFAGGNGTEMTTRGKLRIKPNKGGTYYLLSTGTIQTQGVTAAYDFFLGISKNGANPTAGFYQGCMLNGNLSATATDEDDKTLSITNVISLAAGDTLEMAYRTSSTVPSLRLEAANIFIYRIGD